MNFIGGMPFSRERQLEIQGKQGAPLLITQWEVDSFGPVFLQTPSYLFLDIQIQLYCTIVRNYSLESEKID